jgi:hypothetical protein
MKKFILAVLFAFVLTACPQTTDPYQVARSTITIVRTTATVAHSAFMAADSAKQRECSNVVCIKLDPDKGNKYTTCMGEPHDADPTFALCYKKMKDARILVDKSFALSNAMCNESTEAVNLAEQLAKIKDDKAKLEIVCAKLDPTKGTEYAKCIDGLPVEKADWNKVLIVGACVAYHALDFVPVEYAKYITPVRAVLNSFGGCTK